MSKSVDEARRRAYGRCEALIWVSSATRGKVRARCGCKGQVHHALTRSRGGDLLDRVGETRHLVCLCHQHHEWVHKNTGRAAQVGLYILGQAFLDGIYLVYDGDNEYLSEKYGRDADYVFGAAEAGQSR